MAATQRRIYERARDLKLRGEWSREVENDIRIEERTLLRREWVIQLQRSDSPGLRTWEAISPIIDEWLDRKYGSMSFHLSQLMTGHGCFNQYLYRIGKTDSPICAHCGDESDSAEHTLIRCRTWEEERQELRKEMGTYLEEDEALTLAKVIQLAVKSEKVWRAFNNFAETVMRRKEEEERKRKAAARPAPLTYDDSSWDALPL